MDVHVEPRDLRRDLGDFLPRLRAIVRRIAREEGVVDDVVQECCVRIIEQERLWDPARGSAFAWMTAVSRHVAYRFLSRRRRERLLARAPQAGDVPDGERVSWILNELQALPPRDRKIVELRYFEGLTTVEIARRTGLAQQTVSDAIARIVETLRRRGRSQGLVGAFLAWVWTETPGKEVSLMTAKHTLVVTGVACLLVGTGLGVTVASRGVYSIERIRQDLAGKKRADEANREKVVRLARAGVETELEKLRRLDSSMEHVPPSVPIPGRTVPPSAAPKPESSIPQPHEDFFTRGILPDPHMPRPEVIDFYGDLMKREDPRVDLYLLSCLDQIDKPQYLGTIDGAIAHRFPKSDAATKDLYIAAIQRGLVRNAGSRELWDEFADLACRLPHEEAVRCLNHMQLYAPSPESWAEAQAQLEAIKKPAAPAYQ